MSGKCAQHGEYDLIPGLEGRMVDFGCPVCAEDRIAKHDAKAQEEYDRSRIAKLREMNIEPAYFNVTFDNFKTETPELDNNKSRVRSMVDGRVGKIIMTGKNGTGKTHLAIAALKILTGRIMTMYEISTTIRASYTQLASKTELAIVDELARYPLFVIDEIGRTKGGESEANWLSYIIDKRHTRGLPLILISNKHTRKDCTVKSAQGEQGCPNCLENYVGEDIMSRLSEGGVLLRFTGEDYRRKR
jgi:DNA replication protein DnaC